MNVCHPVRSEGPLIDRKCVPGIGVPRYARDDNGLGGLRGVTNRINGCLRRYWHTLDDVAQNLLGLLGLFKRGSIDGTYDYAVCEDGDY